MSLAGTVLDQPRMLRPIAGYTSDPRYAMRSENGLEPEAISKDDEEVISLQRRAYFAETRAEEINRRDSQMWLERQRRMEMRAQSMGVDIYRQLIEIRRQVVIGEKLLDDAA